MPVLKPLSMDAQGNQSKRYEDTQKEVSKMRDTDDKKININLSSQNSLDKENREASQENSYPLNTAGRKDIESFDSLAKSNELTNNPTIKEESEENNLTEEKMASNMTVQEDTILEKEPQPHTKSGSQEILSTPNQKTLTMKSSPTCFSQSGIKNSPNTSLQVTDIMIEEEEKYKLEDEQQMEKVKAEILDELERTGKQERYQRLQNLLSKSQTYSTYLLGRINDRREKEKKAAEREEKRKLNEEQRKQGKDEKQKLLESQNRREVRGKQIKVEDEQSEEANTNSRKKKRKSEAEETGHRAKKTRGGAKSKVADFDEKSATTFGDTDGTIDQPDEIGRMYNGEKVPEAQPKLMTGGVLRQYQIEGMEWLTGLFENGINGILADEMGLGKTLQSIALIARLIEQKVIGPFLIAAPLSTLPNWIAEFKRFAPQIYTILYHGSKEERMEKRRKLMRIKKYSHGLCSLPVVITSYEIVMRDRVALSSFNVEWKYLIVDEGHRLKNLNCKLIRELKLYDTGNRLLLTGTPLQNDLAELWSLLNFLLPDIFDDLSSFQRWFDFSAMSSSEFIAHEQETNVLQTLHSILTPFLLRRLKSDVDLSIPPKKEVLVRCPMTVQQQNYYKTTLDRSVLDMIAKKTEDLQNPLKDEHNPMDGEAVDIPIPLEFSKNTSMSTENPLEKVEDSLKVVYSLKDVCNPASDVEITFEKLEDPLEGLQVLPHGIKKPQKGLENPINGFNSPVEDMENRIDVETLFKATKSQIEERKGLLHVAEDPIVKVKKSSCDEEIFCNVTNLQENEKKLSSKEGNLLKEHEMNVFYDKHNQVGGPLNEKSCLYNAQSDNECSEHGMEDTDFLFGKIMVKMVKEIPDNMMREMAKIKCQQVMLQYRFKDISTSQC